jgi:hypothetical protein
LTSTVPSPDTLFALTVTPEVEPPALLAALGELALLDPLAADPAEPVLADEPHAATATAPAEIRPMPSSRRADGAEWGRTVMLTRETLL